MTDTPWIELCPPEGPEAWSCARDILSEYARTLGVDLGFQGFEEELASLESHYAPDRAVFLLAWVDGEVAGCGAWLPLLDADAPNACEMKRLYVRAPFRRFGLGRALAESLMQSAQEAGYSVMYLDTLSDMAEARELYASLGFEATEPYYFNPLPGARYFRADLGVTASRY